MTEQADQISVGGLRIDVTRRDVKHTHLSVHPPHGAIRLVAPPTETLVSLRLFALSRLGWMRNQQARFQDHPRRPPLRYVERESVYVWGSRYLLHVRHTDGAQGVEHSTHHLTLSVRPDADRNARHQVFEAWYRSILRQEARTLIARWQERLGVECQGLHVQRMRTKWGSCNTDRRTIRLNTELAKKPPQCLEYVVVHELAHLVVRAHDARFQALLDRHLPDWSQRRDLLNRLPIPHDDARPTTT